MTTGEDLRYDVSDQIAEISLARPPVNALSFSLIEQLVAALRRAAADENVRAVVLTSALPRRFCAGLDLGMILGKSAAEMRRLLDKPGRAGREGAGRGASNGPCVCDKVANNHAAGTRRFHACQRSRLQARHW